MMLAQFSRSVHARQFPNVDAAKYERLRFARDLKQAELDGVLGMIGTEHSERMQTLLDLTSGMNSYGCNLWDGRSESSLAALSDDDRTQGRIDIGLVRKCLAHRAQITRLQAQSERLNAELAPLNRLVIACENYVEGLRT